MRRTHPREGFGNKGKEIQPGAGIIGVRHTLGPYDVDESKVMIYGGLEASVGSRRPCARKSTGPVHTFRRPQRSIEHGVPLHS